MTQRRLAPGFQAFGYIYGISDDALPGNYEIDAKGTARLTILETSTNIVSLMEKDKQEVDPELLHFRGINLSATLSELQPIGRTINFGSRNTTLRFIVGRTVTTYANLSYEEVNGISSTLEGFSRWSEVTAIKQKPIFSTDSTKSHVVHLRAQAKDSVEISARFGVSAAAGFAAPSLDPYQLEYTYKDHTTLRTETPELTAWNEHMQIHRMVQDLLCLVYNYPCELNSSKTYRKDDQPALDVVHKGIYRWLEFHYEDFGRIRHVEPHKDFSKAEPLFLLSDTAEGAVATWLEEPEKWSRPTWIAVETIFQPYLAAESLLIQIGVALEALGYAIWLYEENGSVVPAGRKPSATGYFRRVAEKLPFSDLGISDEQTAKAWAEAFNETYRGCKHADNPLPDGMEAHRRAKQGLNVIRCWLAKKLGVSDKTLIENKNRLK